MFIQVIVVNQQRVRRHGTAVIVYVVAQRVPSVVMSTVRIVPVRMRVYRQRAGKRIGRANVVYQQNRVV